MTIPADLLLVGLSHHTAPVEVREKIAMGGDVLDESLRALHALPGVEEAMVISTCNRLEVYAATRQDDHRAEGRIRALLSSKDPEVASHLYGRRGLPAIRHLFRVCSSLDSMVVGEPQILGQVKEAFQKAESLETVSSLVARSVRRAFYVAKRVRTETAVGRAAVSMSFAGVELAKKVLGSLEGKQVLLVGAGKMSALAARHLVAAGCEVVHVVNRSPERAAELAKEVGGSAHHWDALPELLVKADVVVCSTAAPAPIIRHELIQSIRRKRKHRPLFLIDLAVPRDVEPRVNEIEDVYLFDVDDLDKAMEENRASRHSEAYVAEGIVEKEAEAFYAATWSEAEPLLKRIRLEADNLAAAEVAKTLARHGDGFSREERESVEALAKAIVNKLLHQPTVRIREAGLADDGALLEAAAALFDVERQGPGERSAEEARGDEPAVRLVGSGEDGGETTSEPAPTARGVALIGSGNG